MSGTCDTLAARAPYRPQGRGLRESGRLARGLSTRLWWRWKHTNVCFHGKKTLGHLREGRELYLDTRSSTNSMDTGWPENYASAYSFREVTYFILETKKTSLKNLIVVEET